MGSLVSNLPDEITRGITLNNQHIDLFTIIDDEDKTQKDKTREIVEYLKTSLETAKRKMKKRDFAKLYVDYTVEKLGLSLEDQKRFYESLKDDLDSVFNRDAIISNLQKHGLNNAEDINDTLMEATDQFVVRVKEGITDFLVYDKDGNVDDKATYNKVHAFYDHVISQDDNGRQRYTRIDMDDTGAPTCFMSLQSEAIRSRKIERAMAFCDRHNMSAKINSMFFYLHSHYPSNPSLKTAEDLKLYYQKYIDGISEIIKGHNVKSIDIFNEFVYRDQPQEIKSTSENGEEILEYEYGQRHNGLHALLSLEDICDLVIRAREKMPGLEFVYNDDGWDKPEKREGIFRMIEKIRNINHEKDPDHRLINAIGMQFHTGIDRDPIEIRRAVEECKKRFPDLTVNITELDISETIHGFDYDHCKPEERESAIRVVSYRKKLMMKKIKSLAEEGKISELTLWSQSDEMCFRGKTSKASLNNYDSQTNTYYGKEIEFTREEQERYQEDLNIVLKNVTMNLAKQFKSGNIYAYEIVLSEYMPEAKDYYVEHREEIQAIIESNKREPVQDFNLHTHTIRCGHAADFTEDFEYVNEAIKSGMKRLAFTDHVPFPKGYEIQPDVRMQYEEVDDYIASVNYLKHKYEGIIEVESGFEFEYLPEFESHLDELRSKTDVMILGQHFILDDDGKKKYIEDKEGPISDDVLKKYTELVVSAINNEKDYPDIIAHPDLFMRSRQSFGKVEKDAAYAICRAAASKGVPLEINMTDVSKKSRFVDKSLPDSERITQIVNLVRVPCREFWQIAQECGCEVVYGKDAHYPGTLSEDRDYEVIKAVLGEDLLRIKT